MKSPEPLKIASSAESGQKLSGLGEGLARELVEDLSALYELLKQLADLAAVKLAAMRRADDRALEDCTTQEAHLIEKVFEAEQKRKATLARIAQALQAPRLQRAALSEVAGAFAEPWSSILRAKNAALREVAGKLRQKNDLAARVARDLQSHIRAIFAELAKASAESGVYGSRGQREFTGVRSCLDAVG